MRRGEDINGQCGPFGTALHGALFHLFDVGSPELWTLLVVKGANVNAGGASRDASEICVEISQQYGKRRPLPWCTATGVLDSMAHLSMGLQTTDMIQMDLSLAGSRCCVLVIWA